MGLFDWLFGKKETSIGFSEAELIEACACPNCWGKQEYANEYKQFVADQTKANISHNKESKKAFIAQFVERIFLESD